MKNIYDSRYRLTKTELYTQPNSQFQKLTKPQNRGRNANIVFRKTNKLMNNTERTVLHDGDVSPDAELARLNNFV